MALEIGQSSKLPHQVVAKRFIAPQYLDTDSDINFGWLQQLKIQFLFENTHAIQLHNKGIYYVI